MTRSVVIYVGLVALVISSISYPQIKGQEEQGNTEGTPTKMTKELSCELDPDSGLLCSSSELDLCILRTDLTEVGGGKMYNEPNEAGNK